MAKKTSVSEKALQLLLKKAKEVQKGNLKAAYGAYRVHTRA